METQKAIDILKMAILMERRGYAFYAKVAENSSEIGRAHV